MATLRELLAAPSNAYSHLEAEYRVPADASQDMVSAQHADVPRMREFMAETLNGNRYVDGLRVAPATS